MRAALELIGRLNFRHLRDRPARTGLTIAGIAAGVALAVSIAVLNSTLMSSVRNTMRVLAGDAELEVAAAERQGMPAEITGRIDDVEGVDRAVPVMRAMTMVKTDAGRARVLILGITPEFAALAPDRSTGPQWVELSGGFGLDGSGIVLGSRLADELGARAGTSVRVQTPHGEESIPVSGRASGDVVNVINGGDIGVMFMPAAQAIFERDGLVDSVYVAVDQDHDPDEVSGRLQGTLGGAVTVGPPEQRSRAFEREFGGLTTLTSLTGTVALFVAAFVVYNTMSMSVIERRREISMALALGASRRQIFGAFLTEAAGIGAVAAGIGTLAGIGLAGVLVERTVDGYRWLPVVMSKEVGVSIGHIGLGLGSGIGTALAGALFPARRSLRVPPIESLRPRAPLDGETGEAGVAERRLAILGGASLATCVLCFLAFTAFADESWIANIGMLFLMGGVTLLLPLVVPRVIRSVKPLASRALGPVGRLAFEGLLRTPRRTALTAGALVLTMGLVIGVGIGLTSFETDIERRARFWFGAPLYVNASSCSGFTCDQSLPGDLDRRLQSVDGVKAAYPWDYGFVNEGERTVVIYAIPVAAAARRGDSESLSGTGEDPEAFRGALRRGEVVVSRFTAKNRDLELGDEIALPTRDGRRTFVVGGFFDDLLSWDSLYMEHSLYVKAFGDTHPDRLAIIPERGADLGDLETNLGRDLKDADVAARVITKEELVGLTLDLAQGLLALAQGIQLAALLVAVVTLANTMFAAVLERRWEFGLQQAIGMAPRQVGRLVLTEAAAIGIVGSAGALLLGVILGTFMLRTMDLLYAWSVPLALPWGLIGAAIVAGGGLGALTALQPRGIAMRTPIIESLRYE